HRLAAGPRFSHHRMTEETESGQTKRGEGMPVRRMHVECADNDYEQDDGELYGHNRRIYAGAFADALHQDYGDDQGDGDCRQIKPGSCQRELSRGQVVIEWGVGKMLRHCHVKKSHEVLK